MYYIITVLSVIVQLLQRGEQMFDLDLKSRIPIYEQLMGKFKKLIISDVLIKDEQLPSVRILATELTINPNTIQKAYRELERQGFIYSIPGKGSFVASIEKNENVEKLIRLKVELTALLSEAIYLGMKEEEVIEMVSNIAINLKGER